MKKRSLWMLAAITALLCCLLTVSVSAATVASGTCGAQGDNLTWSLDDAGTLTIQGTGEMAEFYDDDAPWREYTIKSVVIKKGVTTIGANAFENQNELTKATLPEGLLSLGHSAFDGCSLDEIDFPESLESIGSIAFQSNNLSNVFIPRNVSDIGFAAFNCPVTSFEVAGENQHYTAADGVLFDKEMKTLIIYPFEKFVQSYTVPAGVTTIGDNAFLNSPICTIILPESVSHVIGESFLTCHNLTSVTVAKNNPYLCDVDGVLFTKDMSRLIVYPSGKTDVSYAIPAGVTTVGDYAFYYCDSLSAVTFPSGLTSIGPYAFYKCNALPAITIPASVTEIGRNAFYKCESLASVTFMGNAPDFGSNCFRNVTATCRYPAGDATWTEDKLQNYGGTLTWKASGTGAAKPVITASPKRVNTTSTGKAVFSVTATGEGLSYQWQYRKNSSDSWKSATASGSKTNTLTLDPAGTTRNGYQYRCKVTGAGGTVYSGYATLVIQTVSKPVITASPKRVNTTSTGKAVFSVTATGEGLNYQWQYRKNASDTWKSATASGNKTNTLTLNPAGTTRNGYQYRCKVTNAGGAVYSSYATLVIQPAKPVISVQPVSATAKSTDKATFSITATGEGLSYQWQYRKNSSDSWKNATATGNRTNTLTLDPAGTTRNGYQYRCKVTNAGGTVYSGYATLVIKTAAKPVITAQPRSVTVGAADSVTFSVTATGATGYQWQYKPAGSTKWLNNTCTAATFTINPAKAFRNGYQYRCAVTDANGNTVYSSAATLTVQ